MTTAALFTGDPRARAAASAEYAAEGCLVVDNVFTAPQLARMNRMRRCS
jgi:hypothetical protein